MKPSTKHGLQMPRLPKQLPAETPTELGDHTEYAGVSWASLTLTNQFAAHSAFEQMLWRRMVVSQSRFANSRFTDMRLDASDLSGVDLERARFRRVELLGCRLIGAQLVETYLEDVLFREGNYHSAIFTAATCKAVRFERCTLTQASFEGADLTGVVFADCDLTHANFSGATLTNTDFRGSVINGLQVGAKELQGAIIEAAQAVQMVGLLGLQVKERD